MSNKKDTIFRNANELEKIQYRQVAFNNSKHSQHYFALSLFKKSLYFYLKDLFIVSKYMK